MQLDIVEGMPSPGYGWVFATGGDVVNVGVGTGLTIYKSQKRHLNQILALAAAKRAQFPHRNLIFEFTENEQITDAAHVNKIVETYHGYGFLTAIDDFGAVMPGSACSDGCNRTC